MSALLAAHTVLRNVLGERLDARSGGWFSEQLAPLAQDPSYLMRALPMASRYAKRTPLGATEAERAAMQDALPGLEIGRWTELEALRVALLGALPNQDGDGFARNYEEAFRYADDGEQRALFRALPLLPGPERFAWRAGEGCRTNIVPVFESVATDSPYPVEHFDSVAWNQMCIKAIFIAAPLHRIHGLDSRLNPELARMALDLVEERRSAGRPIQPELWLCLGTHEPERALPALEQELAQGDPAGRRAAVLALARAGQVSDCARFVSDTDPAVASAARDVQDAVPTPAAFAPQP